MGFYEENGFLCADGKAMKEHPCQKKLCLVATDEAYLVSVLEKMLERDDCFWVKYSPKPRDGMYLGRVFLTDPRQIGELWKTFKRDDKLLCSVQDDDFILTFR
jgi:hypothetical protein